MVLSSANVAQMGEKVLGSAARNDRPSWFKGQDKMIRSFLRILKHIPALVPGIAATKPAGAGDRDLAPEVLGGGKPLRAPEKSSELTLDELRELLSQRGLVLYTDGWRLLFSSPRPVLSDQLVTELQRHRPTLVQILPRQCPAETARTGEGPNRSVAA